MLPYRWTSRIKMLNRSRWFCIKMTRGKGLSQNERSSLFGHRWECFSHRLLNLLVFKLEQWLKWHLRLDLWERRQYYSRQRIFNDHDADALVWCVKKNRGAYFPWLTGNVSAAGDQIVSARSVCQEISRKDSTEGGLQHINPSQPRQIETWKAHWSYSHAICGSTP